MYSIKLSPDITSFDSILSIRKQDKFIEIRVDEKEAEIIEKLINHE